VPIVPPTELLLDPIDRGRRYEDVNHKPISLAEHLRLTRETTGDTKIPSWEELANGNACAACLGMDGVAVVLCDDCKCGFHPSCQSTLNQLTQGLTPLVLCRLPSDVDEWCASRGRR
jgi:hypothetical protein